MFFIKDITSLDDQIKALNLLIIQLPEANCQTLRLLLRFLNEVVDHQTQNRMTVNNVATVMGPNLFPPRVAKTSSKSSLESLNDGVSLGYKNNLRHSFPIELTALIDGLTFTDGLRV